MSKTATALEAIKAMDDVMITPAEAAPVLGVDANSLRMQVKEDASMLGFSVTRVGGRTLIPRLPFIRFVEGASA